jgi:hypothetical protein
MAIKPFNSTGGYSVGPNLTPFIDENNNANIADLTVQGSINLPNGGDVNANNITASSTLTGLDLVVGNSATITSDLSVTGITDLVDLNASGAVVLNGVTITEQQITTTASTLFEILGTDQGVQLQSLDSVNSTFTMVFADNSGVGLVTSAGEIVVGIDGNVTVSNSMSVVADLTVAGTVSFTGPSVDIGTAGNLKIHGAATGQYLRSLDGAAGTVEWATIDTDTLANGNSNVSIDTVDGPVTIGVAGNANVAIFSGTGLTVQSNIAAGNITSTSNVTTANLTANGLVTLGSNANVKISGGTANLVLTTDGTGNLSWTNQSLKYTSEFHVDPSVGNDTTGDGSYNRPFATVMRAHTVASTNGSAIYLHVGTYTENVTLTKPNMDFIGLSSGGLVRCTGTWTVGTTDPASIRLRDITFVGAFVQNGTGRIFASRCNFNSTFTRTSGSYTQFDEVAAGGGITVNSAGSFVINGGSQGGVVVNHANATVTINNSTGIGTATVTAGTLFLNSSFVYSATATTPSITSSAGTVVYMFNTLSITPTQQPARVSLGGFWSINDSSLDRSNSTLSANNLGTIVYNDAVNTFGLANVASLQVRGTSSLGPVGNITITGGTAGQYLQTNGSGVLSWSTAAVSNIASGTSNVNIATPDGDVTVGVNGQGNIITVASNGTHATTTVLNDMLITGNLAVQGNTITVNVTELNVEDPIITEGRAANNQPLTTNDGKDRGLFSYYFDTAEKGGFIGLRTVGADAGQYILSANATVTDNEVTVNSYGNLILGNVIGNLANGTSSVSIATADGAITLNPTGTANVVVATSTGIDVTGAVKVRTVTSIDAATVTTPDDQPVTLASITDAAGLAVEFVVKGFNTTAGTFETFTILAISSLGACDYTIFGNTQIGGSPGSAIVSVTGGNMVLTVTSAAVASDTTWTVQYRTI